MTFQCRRRKLTLQRGKPTLMGILNVTPDSFSDGGRYDQCETAVAHALEMIDEGAEIIDIGGESTRPGHQCVPADEELRRIIIHGLLHLCGLRDKTDEERQLMQQAEDRALTHQTH